LSADGVNLAMMLFGSKTVSWFDIWSLEHVLSGIGMASLCALLADKVLLKGLPELPAAAKKRYYLLTILFVEYVWEGIEFYMEEGYTHIPAVTYWLQGVEFWGNRLITDPLMTLAGGVIGLHRRGVVLPARILYLIFLLTHVFVFPHCMYLQDLIDHVLLGR
jgi:hypothetical protein